VVIGEGEKDEAPMLFNGERIGDGSAPHVDIAVDPLEGTTLTARGMPSALSVIALSPAERCSTRGRACTWRRSPAAPRSSTCSISTARSARRSRWWRSARGSRLPT